jgi:hypothetical protein
LTKKKSNDRSEYYIIFFKKDKSTNPTALVVARACLPPIPLFFVFDEANPDIITYNFLFVYDIETRKIVYRRKSKIR